MKGDDQVNYIHSTEEDSLALDTNGSVAWETALTWYGVIYIVYNVSVTNVSVKMLKEDRN